MTTQFIYVSGTLTKNSYYFCNCMNRLVFLMGKMCAHCEVGTECLNNICLQKFLISKC